MTGDLAAALRDPRRRTQALTELDGREEFVRPLLRRLGISAGINERFPCVLAGREGERATLWRDRRGFTVYQTPEIGTIALGQLYASVVAGRVWLPKDSSLAVCKVRAILDIGLIDRPDLGVRFPEDPCHFAAPVARGLRELMEVRSACGTLFEGFPLVPEFLRDWCPCTESAALRGRRFLRETGVIVPLGRIPRTRATCWQHTELVTL